MAEIVTASGVRYYIGPSGTSAQYDTLAEFEAVTVWTEIGLVEDGGEYGDESTLVTGAALGDARVRKAKGARDAGTISLIVFHDPTDAGQAAMEVAEQSNDNFVFKVDRNDGPAGYSNTIEYFRGLVSSQRNRIGTNDNIQRVTYNIAVNSEIFQNPAST